MSKRLFDREIHANDHGKKVMDDIFEDPLFGAFKLDRRVNWYEVSTTWGDLRVRLTVPTANTEAALSMAHELWKSPAEWQNRISSCVTNQLLKLKNDAWLDEDENELTADEFKRRILLESVDIDEEGTFAIYYNDGDLFWGHSILVTGNLTDGPMRANIEG